MYTRTCALETCGAEFQTDNPRKKHCSSSHSTTHRMRRLRAKKNKGGGNGGGGGDGGGGLFIETITPQDSRAIYAPDTCYRTPQIPKRKPAVPASVISPGGLREIA